MKRKAMMCMMAALCLGSSMTAYAAPETMPDGGMFDAEYYAQNYPDVVAELGTDKEALYQHYVTFGMYEGRLAYDGDISIANLLEDTTWQEEELQPQITGIPGVVGEQYQLPTWGANDSGDYSKDKMINMTIDSSLDNWIFDEDMQMLAPYTTEGYEWRYINFRVQGVWDDELHEDWWGRYYNQYEVENSKDWEYTGDDVDYARKFTVTQDGIDYTECKYAYSSSSGYQAGDVCVGDGAYFLLPKGFRGKVYYTIKGVLPDGEYGYISNSDAAVTFVF